jgi:hypothetical protein
VIAGFVNALPRPVCEPGFADSGATSVCEPGFADSETAEASVIALLAAVAAGDAAVARLGSRLAVAHGSERAKGGRSLA